MAGRAGFLDRHAGDAAGVPVQQFCRAQAPGQQDRTLRHRRTGNFAGQRGQQPIGQILHVGEALAQIGVADAAHPVMQLAGDTLHRGFGGQAAADHLRHAAQPPGIGGHQPVGLQHLAGGVDVRRAAILRHVGEQVIQTALHAVHRLVKPRLLLLRDPRRAA